MPLPARRVSLAPLSGATEAELTEAAMLLPETLEGRDLLAGEEVRVGSLTLLVTGTTPLGRVTVRADETEIALSPRRPEATRRPVFDVVFLVDASWTMGRDRGRPFPPFAYVRPAIEDFARQGVDLVRAAALVAFSREPVLEQDFVPLAALATARLDDVAPRGPTNLARALEFGVATLQTNADPRDRHALVVFTDDAGEDADVMHAARHAARLGVRVHVVDLAPEPGRALATVAEVTGGSYAHAPETGSLGRAARAMAREIEVPVDWEEAAEPQADDVEFELVLRRIPEEA